MSWGRIEHVPPSRDLHVKTPPWQTPQQISKDRISRLLRILCGIFSTCAQVACALVISQYDPSHTAQARHRFPEKLCLTPACNSSVAVPRAIIDPSAPHFANSVILFGLAVLTSYHLHRHNESQDQILAYGTVTGLVVACSVSIFEGNMGAIKDYMPMAITISLVAFSVRGRMRC